MENFKDFASTESMLNSLIELAKRIREKPSEHLNKPELVKFATDLMNTGIELGECAQKIEVDPVKQFIADLAVYCILAPDMFKEFIDGFRSQTSKYKSDLAERLMDIMAKCQIQ